MSALLHGLKVWDSQVVAEGMSSNRGCKLLRPQEQPSCIDAKHGCIDKHEQHLD